MFSQPPVITIDGPTASGKGTVAAAVARTLSFHYLDSGALYRLTALAALDNGVSLDDQAALATVATQLRARFEGAAVFMQGREVGLAIRQEHIGQAASKIAVFPSVRAALIDCQRAYQREPGLVADGRDMGTVIFPNAVLKVFLTASIAARAERRYKQLIEKGFSANLAGLLDEIAARDERDTQRKDAPLKPAQDARFIDSSALDADQVINQVLGLWNEVKQRVTVSGV